MDLPSRTDLFDAGAREIIARSEARAPARRIAPEALYTEGSDVNVLIAGTSAMAEDVLRVHARHEAASFLDSAKGDALDRFIMDRTGRDLPRKTAAAALVPVTLSRPAASLTGLSLRTNKRLRTRTGVEFELLSTLSLAPGALSATGTARAVLAGTEGNVAALAITEIVETPDPGLRISNLEPATGGTDRESDAAYRERGRAYFGAARRGILAAIELGAKSTDGIALATVEEQLDLNGDPNGHVLVYVADPTGRANKPLTERVKAKLLEYRALGVPPHVIGAVPEYVPIVYRLRTLVGTDAELVFDTLRFATVALANQTPPGKPLEASLLMALARRIPGLIVRDDLLANPVGDVYPSEPGRAVRTRADLVTYVIG